MALRKLALAAALILMVGFAVSATHAASPYPGGTPPAKLLFGLGSEADGAKTAALTQQAPVRMLTSWYNGPGDLAWMTGWKNNLVPQDYAAGYALHLIVYSDVPEQSLATAYGPACGRPYPLSAGFVGDMKTLAQTFTGSGPLYVTLFTEFQTYACTDNQWAGQENYYKALKDQYRAARAIFRQYAPNSRVSIGWGGWQTRWDTPAVGGGKSMMGYFADIMGESDFQSFQAMQSDTNVNDIRNMTSALAPYGPVMLAHYKPDNGSQATFNADIASIFTDGFIADVTKRGLFALSFMDTANIGSSGAAFNAVKAGVTKYASSSLLPYSAPAVGGGAPSSGAGSTSSAKAAAASSSPKPSPTASAAITPAAATKGKKSGSAGVVKATTSPRAGGKLPAAALLVSLPILLFSALVIYWLPRRHKRG